ncbi:MAG: hypothetical protein PGN37_13480 [Mycobacterium kyogaense]|uniref:hypothetical protein n=1 Tax=Mycobacterium kyogaense TaxID=2212479 RepID=UPI002FF566CB
MSSSNKAYRKTLTDSVGRLVKNTYMEDFTIDELEQMEELLQTTADRIKREEEAEDGGADSADEGD